MIAGLFVLMIFLGFIAVMNVHQAVVQPTIPGNLGKQFAGQFRAYSHAALAFAEANPGYVGNISPQQLAPYMGPWGIPSQGASPPGAAATIQNGNLDVWAMPPGMTIPQEEWIVKEMLDTGGDMAYGVNVNGSLISPAGNLGAAPNGVPNGAAVYQIATPHN